MWRFYHLATSDQAQTKKSVPLSGKPTAERISADNGEGRLKSPSCHTMGRPLSGGQAKSSAACGMKGTEYSWWDHASDQKGLLVAIVKKGGRYASTTELSTGYPQAQSWQDAR